MIANFVTNSKYCVSVPKNQTISFCNIKGTNNLRKFHIQPPACQTNISSKKNDEM